MKGILRIALLLALLFSFTRSFAQSPQAKITEYLKLLKADKEDSDRSSHLKWLCYYYRIIGKMDTALKLGTEAADIANRIGSENSQAGALTALGLVYWNQGDFSLALDNFFKALKLYDKLHITHGSGACMVNIGNIYADEGEYAKANEYYFKVVNIDAAAKDTIGLCILNENIGECYENLGDKVDGFEYLSRALKLSEEANYKSGIARNMQAIGDIYYEKGKYDGALDYFTRAEKMSIAAQDKSLIIDNQGDQGKTYLQLKNYKEAEKHLLNAIAISDSTQLLGGIMQWSKFLSDLYSQTGQWQKAYKVYQDYTIAKDSMFNIEKNKKITSNELNYQFEKKESELKASQEKKDAVAREEKKQQQVVIYAVSTVLILVLLLAGFILRGYGQKRKANLVLDRKNRTIEEQKKKVDTAFTELNIKHKEITDSINYAQRIQQALFKDEEYSVSQFPEHFILFKPKNVVSGDFYWRFQKEGHCYLAAVDCTGHGVPGAFLTMLGSAFLNEICSSGKFLTPAEILNQLRDKVVTELSSHGEVKDGMDISLLALSPSRGGEGGGFNLQWAGANNPLWYFANGELKEIEANKQPIGFNYDNSSKQFTNHSIKLNKNDTIYLFTDGYTDQFGGQNGKKFKPKQLKEKLLAISHQPLSEQKEILNAAFEEWKGELEQTDDVCVIGIRI